MGSSYSRNNHSNNRRNIVQRTNENRKNAEKRQENETKNTLQDEMPHDEKQRENGYENAHSIILEGQDWKKDRKDNGENITFPDKNEADNRLVELKKKGRWKDYQIRSSDDKKTWWLEMANPQRIFRVAWTIDDGPHGVLTDEMKSEGLNGLKQVTWYIQRNKLYGKEAAFKKLKAIQDKGGEIAIHSFHPTQDHATWFPVAAKANTSKAYSTPYEGKSENVITKDLGDFNSELKRYGIKVKFVRLPGGLTSELEVYAKTLGLTDAEKIRKIKKSIVAKEDVSSYGKEAIQMQNDFNTLKAKLSELDLLEWSGTFDPLIITTNSWQAETSGVKSRDDSTTHKISLGASEPGSKTDPKQAGIYERKLDQMEKENKSSASLVILAHDSSTADAKAVAEDKKEMERLAEIRGVVIKYETMSSLFKDVTGNDAANYDVKY